MASPVKLDLETELDRIYSLPLTEFVAARNELAKSLRAGGVRQTADAVRALAKPSVTAWAVNTLYHHRRELFDSLLEAAAAVRAALAGKGDRSQANAARREALQTLLGAAAKLLAEAGHAATPANRQRISHTLETLAARDPAAPGPPAGRLTADLEPQGFDPLAGLAASLAQAVPPATHSKKKTGTRATGGPAATTARDDRLVTAQRRVEELEAALATLEQQAEEAEAAANDAIERHERSTVDAIEAERRAQAAAEAAATAKSEMAAARTVATEAKAARRRGRSRLATARRRLEGRRG